MTSARRHSFWRTKEPRGPWSETVGMSQSQCIFSVRSMRVNTHMCLQIQTHPPSSCPLPPPPPRLLTPLCPPGLGRCSQRRCRCPQPELSPSLGCCSQRNSETQRSEGSAAALPLSAPSAPRMSLREGRWGIYANFFLIISFSVS